MKVIEPGLCSVTFRRLAVPAIIDLAGTCGLAAIEWGGDVHVPPGDEAAAADAAARSRDRGINPASYGSYLGARDPIRDAGPVLASAAALGAPNVRIWCPLGVGPDATETQRSAITQGVARAAVAAAELGLMVSLEFHPGTLTETAASTVRLLREVDAPNLFTYWQPVPGGQAGEQQAELAQVRDDLSHLHVFTWGADGSRMDLDHGEAMWSDAFTAVNPTTRWPATRIAFLEFVARDAPEQLVKDAATLRRWLSCR